jgi:hypothetical protein
VILGDAREAAAEIGNNDLEVRIALRVSTDEAPSVAAILNATHNALRGTLTALGVPGVDAALGVWHEALAVEAREAEEI